MDTNYSEAFKKLTENEEDIKKLIEGSHVTMTSSDKPVPYLKMWEKDRKFISEAIKSDGTILDIGCANGFLLKCLMEWSGYTLTPYGIDNNKDHIKDTKTLLPEYKDNFIHSDLETLVKTYPTDFPQQFDYIYWAVWDSWQFESEESIDIIHKLMERIKPDGKLILGFYNPKEIRTKKIDQLQRRQITSSGYVNNSYHDDAVVWFTKQFK